MLFVCCCLFRRVFFVCLFVCFFLFFGGVFLGVCVCYFVAFVFRGGGSGGYYDLFFFFLGGGGLGLLCFGFCGFFCLLVVAFCLCFCFCFLFCFYLLFVLCCWFLSLMRAFTHSAMGCQIDPLYASIKLFLVPGSPPLLVKQMLWHVLSWLWDDTYNIPLAVNLEE